MTNNYALRRQIMWISVCAAALLGDAAIANPTGAVAVNGAVTFNTAGSTLTVTNTPGSIINWQGFSIATTDVTRFVQQSAASTVLNRVVSLSPSSILGTLQSNGSVFLANPNGIVFGPNSVVNVGGLVATTMNLTDANFLAGTHNYTAGGNGAIVAGGSITAQNHVYLIAPNITMSGSIVATQGSIVLAAGRTSVNIVESSAGIASSVAVTGNGTESISGNGGSFVTMNSNATIIFSVPAGGNGNFVLPVITPNLLVVGITPPPMTLTPVNSGNILINTGGTLTVGTSGGTPPKSLTATGGAGNLKLIGATGTGAITLTSPTTASGATTVLPGNGTSGGAITLVSANQTPQFTFGDPSIVKVVENRDASGNLSGWNLTQQ